MAKFKIDFDLDDIPEVKDDVYTCRLGGLEITPEPSEKGFYMAVIRSTIDEGPVRGETIWDRIIVRHATGAEIPLVARRRLKQFVHATKARVVKTEKGIGIDVPDGVRYGVESRSDDYGPKARTYIPLDEMGPSKKKAAAEAFEETPAPKTEKKAEPEVSFEEFD